jgi:hypothetical protein
MRIYDPAVLGKSVHYEMKYRITFGTFIRSGNGFGCHVYNEHKEIVVTEHGNTINDAFEAALEKWKATKAEADNADATNKILHERVRDLESRLESQPATVDTPEAVVDSATDGNQLLEDNLTRLTPDEG